MNRDDLIDALGQMDDDMVEKVEKLRTKNRKPVWIRWAAVAAVVALVATLGWYIWEHVIFVERFTTLELQVIYVNSVRYAQDVKLEQEPTEENIGEFLGYVSYDNKKETKIKAYRYIPAAEETSRIIVPHKGSYDVYEFDGYAPDGTDAWPRDLLKNAARVEIRGFDKQGNVDEKFFITDEKEMDALLLALTQLGEQHGRAEISQRYYERFKNCFSDGAIWIGDDGRLYEKDSFIGNRLSDMIHENEREIVVYMKDNTELSFVYYPAAGLMECYYGYFLSDAQVEQINQLVGLK